MITFEYIQELSKLNKEDLEYRINKMAESEAKELLLGVLSAVFRHDRITIDEIAK